MHLEELNVPLSKIRGVGPASLRTLHSLGLRSVRDLLWHLPRAYQDRSVHVALAAATAPFGASEGPDLFAPREDRNEGYAATPDKATRTGTWINTEATVVDHRLFGPPARQTLKIVIEDESAQASLLCFGRNFLSRQMPVGSRILVCGFAQVHFKEIQLAAFEFEASRPALPAGQSIVARAAGSMPPVAGSNFGRILPVYPLSGDLSQGFFRKVIGLCVSDYARHIDEILPPELLAREGFPSRSEAFSQLHVPSGRQAILDSRRRLIYEELFFLQIEVARRSLQRKHAGGKAIPVASGAAADATGIARATESGTAAAPTISIAPEESQRVRDFIASLPFSLSPDQINAFADIRKDLERPWPAARLIQGDVGSGKTLVALLAALTLIDRGSQAALMVPTVLLARQHAEKAAVFLEPFGVRVALFAGSLASSERKRLLEAVARGEVDLLVGTHALFGPELRYAALDLAIIDEQHRFGVKQRQALFEKARVPNLIMMTATPIPQTLALTVFGDMDVSDIRTMPVGRKPIETHLARMGNEEKVYEWVRKEIKKGHQAYFVYPLIDEGGSAEAEGAGELKNAEAMYRRLSTEVFPEARLGMIHSRMEEAAKESVIAQFAANEIAILVATSVVEVGVDIPNATCMVIEHAERFGLAALHQLRGRVGRGMDQSYCFLVYQEPLSEVAKSRLRVLKESNDGFQIAEQDLAIRGPGDIKGIQQSGFLKLRVADLSRDMAIMNTARRDAFDILERDPELGLPQNRALGKILDALETESDQETTN